MTPFIISFNWIVITPEANNSRGQSANAICNVTLLEKFFNGCNSGAPGIAVRYQILRTLDEHKRRVLWQ